MSLLLGVNIDHVATLRQARYALVPDFPYAEPSVLQSAQEAQNGGADSITAHVRADRRHMQEHDVFCIKKSVDLPLNLEMGATQEMLDFALKLQPEYVCLVPETREEVTTEGGLEISKLYDKVARVADALQQAGIKVSLFIDPEEQEVLAAQKMGVFSIELHTGSYANALTPPHKEKELQRLNLAASLASKGLLKVHAGHGITVKNLSPLLSLPSLRELNIGHTIVARALSIGMKNAVAEMKRAMHS